MYGKRIAIEFYGETIESATRILRSLNAYVVKSKLGDGTVLVLCEAYDTFGLIRALDSLTDCSQRFDSPFNA